MAGAREQILKLGVFLALFAIFLLGFESDRLKNVFTERTASVANPPSATAQPAATGQPATTQPSATGQPSAANQPRP